MLVGLPVYPPRAPLKLERLDVNNKVMETIIDTPNDGNYLVPIVAGPAGNIVIV